MENPVEVSIKIPDYVYVGDDIQSLKIAVWSAEKQEWQNDFITFPQQKEDKKNEK